MEIVEWGQNGEKRSQLIDVKALDSIFQFDKENEKLFFLISKEKIYGYAILKMTEIPELKRIFILPKLRNNGYGTTLLNYMVNWLIKNNYDKIIVKNHKKMDNFLEKQKFIKNGNDYELNNLMEYKNQEKTMLFVSKIAIVVNIILALLKIITGKLFLSASLLADGLNSTADLITNILVILGLKVGGNPEDKEHPFGHGKIESVFSIIIGTFIMITAFDMMKENITNLINRQSIIMSSQILIITVIALLIKITQFLFMKYKTKKYRGALINSLLKDYKADIIITSSVIVGILLSNINSIFDTIIGFLVSLYIIKEGYNLIKENSLVLLDSQNEELLDKIKSDLLEFEKVENAHDFMMTTSGKDVYLFFDIRVNGNMNVEESHEITNEISKYLKHKYENLKLVFIHVEPMYDLIKNDIVCVK